jgi:hypothetical protein
MSKITFDYKTMRAEIILKHDIDLDETSMAILFILLNEIKEQHITQQELIVKLISKVNASQHSLQVDHDHPRWQAFWFGAGKFGLALLLAILFSGSYYWYYLIDKKQKEQLPSMYLWYKGYYENTQGQSKKSISEYINRHPMPQ